MTDPLQVFHQVLERTFEDFAFMFIEPVPVSQIREAEAAAYVRARISYAAQEEKGELVAMASMDFCRCLSQNILGMDPDEELPPGTAESALSELVNVACGSLAEALYGTEQAVDLHPSEYALCTAGDWAAFMDTPPILALLVDDYPVGFCLGLFSGDDDTPGAQKDG